MATRSESRQKTKLIQVRATPAEKAKLKRRAEAFDVSMGELCREAIFRAVPKSKVDQDAIQELAALRADLGRLGGLLKGYPADSFPIGTPPPKTKTGVVALLHEIEAAQKLVVDTVKKVASKS